MLRDPSVATQGVGQEVLHRLEGPDGRAVLPPGAGVVAGERQRRPASRRRGRRTSRPGRGCASGATSSSAERAGLPSSARTTGPGRGTGRGRAGQVDAPPTAWAELDLPERGARRAPGTSTSARTRQPRASSATPGPPARRPAPRRARPGRSLSTTVSATALAGGARQRGAARPPASGRGRRRRPAPGRAPRRRRRPRPPRPTGARRRTACAAPASRTPRPRRRSLAARSASSRSATACRPRRSTTCAAASRSATCSGERRTSIQPRSPRSPRVRAAGPTRRAACGAAPCPTASGGWRRRPPRGAGACRWRASRRRAPAARPRRRRSRARAARRRRGPRPARSSATPNTAQSTTAGWPCRTASISAGATWNPLTLIISLQRSVRWTQPSGSSQPTSPVRYQPSSKASAVASSGR